jgi:hypothetical protein
MHLAGLTFEMPKSDKGKRRYALRRKMKALGDRTALGRCVRSYPVAAAGKLEKTSDGIGLNASVIRLR